MESDEPDDEMRDYAKVLPSFWMGETGRWIRAQGPDHLLVAIYLLTSPHSHMIGLYYLPLVTMAYEIGLDLPAAKKALARLSEAPSKALQSPFEGGFAWYDEAQQVVWIPQMARYQIGERLSPKDNNVKAIQKEAEKWRKSPFFVAFHALYNEPLSLQLAPPDKALQSPFEGPSEPLRSQETEQEQEEETEQESKSLAGGSSTSPAPVQVALLPDEPKRKPARQTRASDPAKIAKSTPTWQAYADAYEKRYGKPPTRSKSVSSKLCALVDDFGADVAPALARYYLTHPSQFYAKNYHPIGLLLHDAQALKTQMETGQIAQGHSHLPQPQRQPGDILSELTRRRA